MKFIHVSDLHLVPKGDKLWGLDPFQRFEACLDDIVKFHRDAAFVVISGDLTERGGTAEIGSLRYEPRGHSREDGTQERK